MDDGVWKLIEDCWKHNPAERPTMTQIVEKYVAFLATLPSLLKTLREVSASKASIHETNVTQLAKLGGSMINDLTLRLLCRLLEQYESDTIASELGTVSDVELLLDFVLHVCTVVSAIFYY